MARLHLTVAHTDAGGIEVLYCGPDRLAAKNAFEDGNGSPLTELFSFIERTAVRKHEAVKDALKKKKQNA